MVDPVNLFFLEYLAELLVQLSADSQIVAEWLLNDETVPALRFQQAAIAQIERHRSEQLGRQRQIEQAVARNIKFRVQLLRQICSARGSRPRC